MRIVLALLMLGHGIAHLVGFVVPWRLAQPPGVPYRTTILRGAIDLGVTGVRIYGCLWLLLAVAFAVVAAGLVFRGPWWYRGTLAAAAVSTLFCLLSWPEARIGVFVNMLITAAVIIGTHFLWLPVASK